MSCETKAEKGYIHWMFEGRMGNDRTLHAYKDRDHIGMTSVCGRYWGALNGGNRNDPKCDECKKLVPTYIKNYKAEAAKAHLTWMKSAAGEELLGKLLDAAASATPDSIAHAISVLVHFDTPPGMRYSIS